MDTIFNEKRPDSVFPFFCATPLSNLVHSYELYHAVTQRLLKMSEHEESKWTYLKFAWGVTVGI